MSRFHKSSWGGRNRRSGNSEDKHYFGHDDRVPKNNGGIFFSKRPSSFLRKQTKSPHELFKNLAISCMDDDVQMATGSNNNNRQVIVRGRPRGGAVVRRDMLARIRPPILADGFVYKIVIPYGHKYEKEYVINNLLSYMAPETFVPIMYKIFGNEASFYVDDYKSAMAILNCNQKITTIDGFKLYVKVFQPPFPHCEVDNKLKEKLKQAMAKRYVNETNALDLSKFHQDPDLATDYFYALHRPLLWKTVLDIVSEHIPNLEALNLDGNRLLSLDRSNILNKKFPKLKILYIGDNMIKDIKQLEAIKDLKLEELKLTGNPVCNKYKNRQTEYISEVRKRFPKLLRLDGTELPKPILFDLTNDGNKMPLPRRMFVSNAKAQNIASQFLQQYFLIFDSDNRQALLDAYDEHACFSMTTSCSHNNSNKSNIYFTENRNLYRVNNSRRQKLLKQGRLIIVSFLSEIPQTQHYLNTFTMDISLATEVMMVITVTGFFKELDKKDQFIRYFNRTFIIVPEGSGYCIRNEQLHISNASNAQIKHLNSQVTTQAKDSGPQATTSSGTAIKPPVSSQLSEDVKQQMTMTLSQQTNMNLEWSLKCLEEVQWNYDNALSAFQEFFKRGQIPPEAFNK
ncbi:PREDICTED: nuclear RNA export factor 1-like [Dufourea novaeangliae]|uniref:Nuclear RNA export factor 1 n=1 Tax=Dufourea novaeangliae TaxID=178035 RepID=A0A154PM19_DUFNO|nr:PREDICTED: nuclear RNA export factor 1-like [Dufourea novaeangliae]KZC12807.1 Nuclear RNA export factor 1 [Dufourea novaeangliae]